LFQSSEEVCIFIIHFIHEKITGIFLSRALAHAFSVPTATPLFAETKITAPSATLIPALLLRQNQNIREYQLR